MNANYESMVAEHGEKEARRRMERIADIGGYGNVPHNYIGGLDVFSALDPTNETIPEQVKDEIAQLAGVKRKDADTKAEAGNALLDKQDKGNATQRDVLDAKSKGAVLPNERTEVQKGS